MQKIKAIFLLGVTAILAVSCCTYRVDTPITSCDQNVDLHIYSPVECPADSIINIDHQKLIEESFLQPHYYPDSGYCRYTLPLDPNRENSAFVIFYSFRPADTLVIRHQYEEAYTACSGTYLEIKSRSIEYTTFPDPIVEDHLSCMLITVEL